MSAIVKIEPVSAVTLHLQAGWVAVAADRPTGVSLVEVITC